MNKKEFRKKCFWYFNKRTINLAVLAKLYSLKQFVELMHLLGSMTSPCKPSKYLGRWSTDPKMTTTPWSKCVPKMSKNRL